MNYSDQYPFILQELSLFTPDETIYKEFYLNPPTKEQETAFRERYMMYPTEVNYLLNPESIASYHPEEKFFSLGHNVSIVKHPRYFPLFYHEHAFFEIVYVVSGTCLQHFQDRNVTLQEGDLCLISPDTEHGIEVFDDDSIILNLLIKRSTFLDIFLNSVRDKTQLSLFFLDSIYARKKIRYLLYHTGTDPLIRNHIFDLLMENKNDDEFSDRILSSMLMIFFLRLTRDHGTTLEICGISKSDKQTETRILNYMLDHYSTITLADLAEAFHFSVPYCSKLIKDLTGQTFSDLLTSIRLQAGENLLLYTQLPITEISNQLGYKNPETFTRVFQRFHNLSPAQFRKNNGTNK